MREKRAKKKKETTLSSGRRSKGVVGIYRYTWRIINDLHLENSDYREEEKGRILRTMEPGRQEKKRRSQGGGSRVHSQINKPTSKLSVLLTQPPFYAGYFVKRLKLIRKKIK